MASDPTLHTCESNTEAASRELAWQVHQALCDVAPSLSESVSRFHVIHDGSWVFSLFIYVTGSWEENGEKVRVAFPSSLFLI